MFAGDCNLHKQSLLLFQEAHTKPGRRGCFDHENLVSYSVAGVTIRSRPPDSMMLRGWIFSLVAWNSMEHFTFWESPIHSFIWCLEILEATCSTNQHKRKQTNREIQAWSGSASNLALRVATFANFVRRGSHWNSITIDIIITIFLRKSILGKKKRWGDSSLKIHFGHDLLLLSLFWLWFVVAGGCRRRCCGCSGCGCLLLAFNPSTKCTSRDGWKLALISPFQSVRNV